MAEYLDVVDENDVVLRKALREEVIRDVLIHRTARVLIKNTNQQYLVQKRTVSKDMYPGFWDVGIAETVQAGEVYEAAAMRGLVEEIGMRKQPSIKQLFSLRYRGSENKVNSRVFFIVYDGPIVLQKEEVSETRWVTFRELQAFAERKQFHPVGKLLINKYAENV